MKKLLALILAVLLMLSYSGLCEMKEAPTVYDWTQIAPYAEQIDPDGKMMIYEDYDLLFWVPSALTQTEITQEQSEAGWLDCYVSEADPEYYIVVLFNFQGEGLETVEDLLGAIEGQYDDYTYANINGFNALMLMMNNNTTMTVVISAGDGYFLQIIYNHVDDEANMNLSGLSLASIQHAPEN